MGEIHVNSSFLSRIIDFTTAYLELIPEQQPNISLIAYPYKENRKHKFIPIERLGLLNSERHVKYLFGKYVIDYFFMPRRRGIETLQNRTFILKKEGADLFQMKHEYYRVITGDIIAKHIGHIKFRNDPNTNSTIAVISEKD